MNRSLICESIRVSRKPEHADTNADAGADADADAGGDADAEQ
jgi:hypothetical protein